MILNGDCFELMSDIPDKSVNLILVDPPYHISKESHFKNHSNNTPKNLVSKYSGISIDFGDWDKKDIDWNLLFRQYYRILKDGGTLIIFYDIWKCNIIKDFAEKNKFKQPRVCQWQKTNPVPVNSKINYLSNATEYFFTFVKGKKPTFNSEYDNGVYRVPICHGKERFEHPTQKPVSLFIELIKKHSNPGDLVLDSFAGTGTTACASILSGRNWIVIEKEDKYLEILKKRVESLLGEINPMNI